LASSGSLLGPKTTKAMATMINSSGIPILNINPLEEFYIIIFLPIAMPPHPCLRQALNLSWYRARERSEKPERNAWGHLRVYP
jgi:hypothetical protein